MQYLLKGGHKDALHGFEGGKLPTARHDVIYKCGPHRSPVDMLSGENRHINLSRREVEPNGSPFWIFFWSFLCWV